jgi:hypothetical protein
MTKSEAEGVDAAEGSQPREAGARLAGNVLWLAGPANTLFALAAEGIASLGERSRPLTQEEYDGVSDLLCEKEEEERKKNYL